MAYSKKLRQSEFTNQNRSILKLLAGDFLLDHSGTSPYFHFIIANPPYVRLEQVSRHKREIYKDKFETAVNRFDLYILFFESPQAVEN
jgi:adenine-specific DNA-methyltransferase